MNHVLLLDHGFARFEQAWGTDKTIARAAWVSTGAGSGRTDAEVESVIRYMATHDPTHWTPFGHVGLTVHFKMPLFVARQWMKSTVGFVVNEESRRYVSHDPDFYHPDKWRGKGENIKQGSIGEVEYVTDYAYEQACVEEYRRRLAAKVCNEQARMCLPVNTYTELWQTGSLFAWARIVGLRWHKDAQWETKQYAKAVSALAGHHFPVAWKYLIKSKPGT